MKILALHGKMKKNRSKIFDEFRSSENCILICTDVMARGIDVPRVDWVLQYDPPSSASNFVHRYSPNNLIIPFIHKLRIYCE